MPIKFRWPQDVNAIRFGATLVWGVVNGIITTIQGTSPLALVNAVAGRIKSLVQYGKCTTVDDEIYCNNGKLVAVDDELPAGYKRLLGITFDSNIRYETGEALTGDDDVTMTLDNLSSSGKNVFGSYNGANGKNFSLYIYGSASTGSYFRFGDQLKRPKYGTGKRTITFGKSGTSGFDSDSDVTPDEFTTPANVYIGMLPNSSSAAYAGDIIGSIIVSNRLEWIPCERESDGVIGYYEKYNGNFLEPVGSGSPVSLGYDTSHLTVLSVDGTPEVLMVTGEESESLSGDIVSFEVNKPSVVSALNVNVELIQDLHGYDSPWPAGGGKNKLNLSAFSPWTSAFGLTTTINNDGSISITGTVTEPGTARLQWRILAAPTGFDPTGLTFIGFNLPSSKTITFRYDSNLNSIVIDVISLTQGESVNWKIYLLAYEGSTAPTEWSPYSNICPISGRTSATVTRTGRNMLNSSIVHGIWTVAGWYDHENYNTKYLSTRYAVPVVGGKTYCFSLKNDSSNPAASGSFIAFANGNAIREPTWFNIANGIIDVPSGADSIAIDIVLTNNFASISDVSATDFQLELGSTASAYEPYAGNTYTIQIGDTVYGGTLDVTGGKMVVDRAIYDFGTGIVAPVNGSEDARSQGLFSAYGFTPPVARVTDISAVTAPDGIICNQFVAAPNNAFLAPGRSPAEPSFSQYATSFYVQWNGLAGKTNADAKAILTGTQIAAPLATPFEITLTPTQIDTLLGTNNIWADTGSIESLKYKAMQTASVENLFAVDDIKDEQNIISGTVTRRCEAVVSDGTTPSGRYIGEVGDGNIIVKVRESGYDGDVATFEADRAEPLNGLTVNVEPTQDLHGYDNPWPAGGGKQLYNSATFSTITNGTITCTNNGDGSFTFNADEADTEDRFFDIFKNQFDESVGGTPLPSAEYRLTGTPSGGSFNTYTMYSRPSYSNDTGNGVTFTNSVIGGSILIKAGYRPQNLVFRPMIRLASNGDDTYAPYSNICPISGRTSATVTRTGKNLLNLSSLRGGEFDRVRTLPAYNISTNDYLPIKGGQEYVWSQKRYPKSGGRYVQWYDIDKLQIGSVDIYPDSSYPLTAPDNACFARFMWYLPTQYQSIDDIIADEPMIQYGSTATAYEPYQGNTYTIQIGDTVYGGTLDVTGGKMVVDRAMYTPTAVSSGAYQSRGRYSPWVTGVKNEMSSSSSIVCNLLPIASSAVNAHDSTTPAFARMVNGSIVFNPYGLNYASDEEAQAAGNQFLSTYAAQFCYELATPFEITLTPTQIETLLGANNIWSDAGAVKAYVADGDVIEHVTAHPLRTAEGSNTVSVTSAVAPVELKVDYSKNE